MALVRLRGTARFYAAREAVSAFWPGVAGSALAAASSMLADMARSASAAGLSVAARSGDLPAASSSLAARPLSSVPRVRSRSLRAETAPWKVS